MSKQWKYAVAAIVVLFAVALWYGRHSIAAEVMYIHTTASEVEASGV